ncbi:MAG: tetratricopeptide repeat protein [Nitrospirae bacterium]|nr:tetratricopeptide repeat protein [Nitrospirota bacterium]MCL5285608.1 tetratricopeptide repeat protein [Nitrospirota bacterium]
MIEVRFIARGGLIGVMMLSFLPSACTSVSGTGQDLPSLEREAHRAMSEGNLKKARDLDIRALVLAPDDAALLNNLAVVQDRLGEEDKALQTLEMAKRKASGDARILLNLARIELKLGQEGKAFRTAGKIIPMDKWPDGFRTLMGKIDIDLAHYREAHVYLHEALERHPENPLILTYLGIVHFRLGERTDARKNFQDALALNPPPKLRRLLERLLSDPEKVLGRSPAQLLQGRDLLRKGPEGSP